MNPALPYCGPAPGPATLLTSWNLDPLLLAALVLAAITGAVVLRKAAAPKRSRAFGLAMAALVLAFVSPLCALTVALFSARAVHHLVLIGFAAPALALAFPLRRVPLNAAWAAVSVALLGWHIPALYTAAWDSAALYWLMQAALLLPAWAFWSVVFTRSQSPLAPFVHAGLIAGLAGQMGFLGAILTFAPRALYAEHLTGTEAFGLTLLADQQLAGLIMWVPGMLPFALVAALALQAGWRRQQEGAA
ncbi:cytochrome c oxidase assembly protein [Pararhodobacter sp.]|uniref:cytochrome c oxidase assembly protein n=1 Tax=Pararhodobacter sp. TaxID=2127056 RepID=UPI002FDD2261